MTFIDAYMDMWRRYTQFDGRTSPGGFWRAFAIDVVIQLTILVMAALSLFLWSSALIVVVVVVYVTYGLASLTPHVAMVVRRLHDSGKSGWLILVVFIPLPVGTIVILVLLALPADPGANFFGPPPRGNQWTTDGFAPAAGYAMPPPGTTPPPPPPPPSAPPPPSTPPPPPRASY